jgi:hypothetical protein
MADPRPPLPVPDLEPRPITADEYMAHTPEKLELWSGYLIHPPEDHEARRALLALLMTNLGLLDAVRLAPRRRWIEALARAYGPHET